MSTEQHIFTVPISSDLGALALRLRRDVFVIEQHVPADIELDQADFSCVHVVAVVGGDVVGTLRIISLPEHTKIGRVAVAIPYRGRGIARAMMLFAMEFARARGETRLYLTAQTDKLSFYEKLGFVAFGSEFQDGGMPHLPMKTY